MAQVLILDYGGVYSFEYVALDQQNALKSLFAITELPPHNQEIFELNDQFSCGLISTEEFIERFMILSGAKVKPSSTEYEEAMISHTFLPSSSMVNLVRNARKHGVYTILLSDLCNFEIPRAKSKYMLDEFDKAYLSAEHGTSKNHDEYFRNALEAAGAKTSQALFVDDREVFIENARRIGLRTLLADKNTFSTALELSEEIARLLRI